MCISLVGLDRVVMRVQQDALLCLVIIIILSVYIISHPGKGNLMSFKKPADQFCRIIFFLGKGWRCDELFKQFNHVGLQYSYIWITHWIFLFLLYYQLDQSIPALFLLSLFLLRCLTLQRHCQFLGSYRQRFSFLLLKPDNDRGLSK